MNKVRKLAMMLVVAALVLPPAGSVLAADTLQGTGAATPGIIDVAWTSGNTWTINGLTGNSLIDKNTTYYSNPLGDTTPPSATVVDGECLMSIDNTSNVITDVYADISDFTGGDAMQNSETGSAGVGEYGAYSYYSGMTYSSKVVAKTTGSSVLKSGLASNTDILVGYELTTQTDDFTSLDAMAFTYDISFVAN